MLSAFEEFTDYYFAPIVFVLGFIGNLLGMVMLSRKRLTSKLYMSHVYMYLFVSDMFYLVTQLPITNLQQSYPSLNPLTRAEWFCKLWIYSDLALPNTSPMILLYISIDRLVAVKFPAKRLIMRKHKNILLFTVVITLINLIYYIPMLFYYYVGIHVEPETNLTRLSCTIDKEDNIIINWMYVAFNEVIPYFLTVLCTILLCVTIFQSRRRTEANQNIRRDVKFTITSISLNVAFIVLTLPISVVNFFSNIFVDTVFKFCNILFFSAYGINFYFLVIFNSIFREDLLRLSRLLSTPSTTFLRSERNIQ